VTAAAATLPAPKPGADPNGELVLERPPRLPRVSDEARAERGRGSAMASLGRLKSAIFDREERKM